MWRSVGNFLVRWYFLLFTSIKPQIFTQIFFFAENYISVLFATWNGISIYFVPNISQVILVFIFCRCLCYARKKPQYFILTIRKSFTWSHLTKVQAFFYETFEEFDNDLYLWKKMMFWQLKKAKYAILAPTLHIFLYLLVQYTV